MGRKPKNASAALSDPLEDYLKMKAGQQETPVPPLPVEPIKQKRTYKKKPPAETAKPAACSSTHGRPEIDPPQTTEIASKIIQEHSEANNYTIPFLEPYEQPKNTPGTLLGTIGRFLVDQGKQSVIEFVQSLGRIAIDSSIRLTAETIGHKLLVKKQAGSTNAQLYAKPLTPLKPGSVKRQKKT